MTAAPVPERSSGCNACALRSSRRAFLRDTAAAAALVSLGATNLMAEPLRYIMTVGRVGSALNYPIPSADGAHVDSNNEVILVRWQGAVYAFNLACPHQNTALKWDDGERRFQCPKHHSRYQPDGTFIDGRATRGMDRFPITRTGSGVSVDVDHMIQQDKDAQAWASAFVRL